MWHFSLFCKFFGEEVETVFRESKSEPPKWFHFKVCQRKYFRNLLKLPWSQKRIFWEFENEFLNFFAHFSVNKLKMFLGKARQSIQNCVNPKLDIEKILENGFETTLRWKADILLNLILKKAIFSFSHIFESRSWNRLLWKQGKAFKGLRIPSWSW